MPSLSQGRIRSRSGKIQPEDEKLSYLYGAMGWILKQLFNLLNSAGIGYYAVAIAVFTILINAIFLPLNIKQQKTTAKQTAIRPKMDAIKEKCGDDRQKYSLEVQELNQREGISMMGGCLPMLIRLPFLWGVWRAISNPLSYILNWSSDLINSAKGLLSGLEGVSIKAGYEEIGIIDNFGTIVGKANEQGLTDIASQSAAVESFKKSFNLFGIDMTRIPTFTLNFADPGVDFTLWIIPFLSFASSMLSSIISMRMQKKINPEAAQMGGMMFLMPLFSLYISFLVPGAVGFYWICSNLVNMVIQVILNKTMSPYRIIAKDEARFISDRKKKESALKAKKA